MKNFRIVATLIVFAFGIHIKAQTVYVTKTGEKYHKEHCQYLRYSKIEIKLDKAIKLLYDPCLVCKPPKGKNKTTTSDVQKNELTPSNSTPKRTKSTTAVRCSGTTQSGNRCKRMTKSSNRRCYQH